MKENENVLKKLNHIEKNLNKLEKEESETIQSIEKLSLVEKKLEDKIDLLEQEVHGNSKVIKHLVEMIDDLKNIVKEKDATIENLLLISKDSEKSIETVKIVERKVYVLEKKNLGNVFCEYCAEEFDERRKLEVHEIHTHTFKCEVCKNQLESKET